MIKFFWLLKGKLNVVWYIVVNLDFYIICCDCFINMLLIKKICYDWFFVCFIV